MAQERTHSCEHGTAMHRVGRKIVCMEGDESMSNLYVATMVDLFNGDWIATLTPYEHCVISEDGYYMVVEESPETHIGPEKWEDTPGSIPIETLKLCIELDGDLYIWKEWDDI